MMGLNEDDYSTGRQTQSLGTNIVSNQRYVVFLPLNDDGTVQMDSEYFSLYNEEDFSKYVNPQIDNNEIKNFDTFEFPNRESATKFKELVMGTGGDLSFMNKKNEIGEPSSVEDDDYDEREERNYGVDDEPSDDETFNGFGREGGISYDTGDSWQGR
jgi:hypothetical protein